MVPTGFRSARPLFLLAPQLYGGWGGVQTYMRRLREMLGNYAEMHGFRCECISLVDASEQPELHTGPVRRAAFCGCSGSKSRFIFRSVASACRRTGGVAIVGHLGQAPMAWALKQAGLLRSYIVVLHGFEAWERARWLKRKAAGNADYIVATTRYTGQEFCRANEIPEHRLRVIALAIAGENVASAGQRAHPEEFVLLAVSRLSVHDRYKGIDTVIQALRLLREDAMRVSLRIVGSGVEQRRLSALANDLGVADRVRLLGAVSQAELDAEYAACDVFTLPSAEEGFGIVFLEAMRHGKPCIGARRGGIPEVIDHGVDGYLVEYGDAAQLAHSIRRLLENPELTQAMGRAARRKVADRYCFRHMQGNWFRLLDEALAEVAVARARPTSLLTER